MESRDRKTPDTEWRLNTRILHWLLAITVTFQLASSLFMADTPTQFLLPIHELFGLLGLASVAAFWFFAHLYGELRFLLPWNAAGAAAVTRDLRGLLHGRLPPAGRCVGLSGFVHGLGLLALTGSALTGLDLFFLAPLGAHAGPAEALAFTSMSLHHAFFGKLVWVYFVGHVLFALLHQARGGRVLGGIFRVPLVDEGAS